MTKEEFAILFRQAVDAAIDNAERKLNRTLPRKAKFLLRGWDSQSPLLDEDETLNELYLDKDHFFRIIDLGVIRYSSHFVSLVARRSGHQPSAFNDTWNEPKGRGPFKEILLEKIDLVPDEVLAD